MKPLRTRLQEARKQLGLPWEVLERDYLLSWILAGINQVDALRDRLVFKGGTALKKCYFGDYRFSEDLDFTALPSVPTGPAMESAMREACARAVKLLDPYAPVEILCQRHVERDPHPAGQEAFDIRARFPWHRRPQVNAMVETAMDEKVLKPTVRRSVLHDYGEPFGVQVTVYSLEEIVAEKLRAILQHLRSLERRGWVRSRARDYYDLWRILGAFRDRLDVSGFSVFLREKCALKDVAFSGPRASSRKRCSRTWRRPGSSGWDLWCPTSRRTRPWSMSSARRSPHRSTPKRSLDTSPDAGTSTNSVHGAENRAGGFHLESGGVLVGIRLGDPGSHFVVSVGGLKSEPVHVLDDLHQPSELSYSNPVTIPIPDDIRIDFEVRVHDSVTHRAHQVPRYVRTRYLHLVRNVARGLPYDHEVGADRSDGLHVGLKVKLRLPTNAWISEIASRISGPGAPTS